MLCRLDTALVAKIFPAIKGVYSHLSEDHSQSRVLLTLLQFFINYSKAMHFKEIPIWHHLWTGCFPSPEYEGLFPQVSRLQGCYPSPKAEGVFPKFHVWRGVSQVWKNVSQVWRSVSQVPSLMVVYILKCKANCHQVITNLYSFFIKCLPWVVSEISIFSITIWKNIWLKYSWDIRNFN